MDKMTHFTVMKSDKKKDVILKTYTQINVYLYLKEKKSFS